jgi:hypothetical protein
LLTYSTINVATVAGESAVCGNIAEGKLANFLMLKNNPADDYRHLFDWDTIWIKGKPLARSALLKPGMEELVQRQVNAYNARDLEAFMACFSKDCQLYEFGTNKLLMNGEKDMRERYGKMFLNIHNLHCTITGRMTIGNKAVAIYEVADGKIVKCWFIR